MEQADSQEGGMVFPFFFSTNAWVIFFVFLSFVDSFLLSYGHSSLLIFLLVPFNNGRVPSDVFGSNFHKILVLLDSIRPISVFFNFHHYLSFLKYLA